VERQQPAPSDEERLARFLSVRRSPRSRRYLHTGERFGLFSIQLFFHYSGFNLGFNLLYCPLFGTVGVGGVYAAM